ncbi:MAG: phage tail spike protein, partial [Ignavibacteria bacterium]|nr:phage tail spike protein [Ignavibacteria bacterium]
VNTEKNFKFQGGTNYLEALRDIERVYYAEVVFDTLLKTVGYKVKGGVNQGRVFERGKDLQIIEIIEDASRAIYRLYPYGRRELDISSVNAGLKYLDAPDPPYTPPPSRSVIFEEIEDPTILKSAGEALLLEISKPEKSYDCKVIDLSQATPPEPFPTLGDLVTVKDPEIEFDEVMRVVALRYYEDEPFGSEITLSIVRRSALDMFMKYDDFVNTGQNYWETTISDYDGALIKDEDGKIVADQWGLNTGQYKKFPNQAFNSSFELYDATNKPDYWDTTGEVTDDARFDNTHSLQLDAGQYAEQKEVAGIGLPNPSWWPWSTGTRYSFRCRGDGGVSKIRVKVYLDAVLKTIWTWREKDGSYAVKESGTQLDFDINPD